MKALVLSGPPAVGKSTVAQALLTGSTLRAVIEVDELRTQADRLSLRDPDLPGGLSEHDRDSAAVLAAVWLARPLLERDVQVLILDDLGSRFGENYRDELSAAASVSVVRLDVGRKVHEARNRSRPVLRQYTADTLDFFRTSARKDGRPDLVIDTTGNQPDQTARALENLLRV